MVTVSTSKQTLKQSKIRYTEYYDLQKVLDDLYEDSGNNNCLLYTSDAADE